MIPNGAPYMDQENYTRWQLDCGLSSFEYYLVKRDGQYPSKLLSTRSGASPAHTHGHGMLSQKEFRPLGPYIRTVPRFSCC